MSAVPEKNLQQRKRLLEGLLASIREKGLAQTQLTDIVRHAKASRRTFYNHFPDKDSCFVELTELVTATVREQVVAAIDREAAWPEHVDQAIDAFLEGLAAEPQLTLTFASPSLGERIVRAQRDAIDRFAEVVVDLVAGEAFRTAAVRPITHERAYFLIGGLHLLVVRTVEEGRDPTTLGDELKTVFKTVLGS